LQFSLFYLHSSCFVVIVIQAASWSGQGAAAAWRGSLWLARAVPLEVAAGQGHGMGGWRAAAAGQGRGLADRGRSSPVTKPSTKVFNARKKHKFVYKTWTLQFFLFSLFSYTTLYFHNFLIIDRDDLYFFSHITWKVT
jgi:hypothetical protein